MKGLSSLLLVSAFFLTACGGGGGGGSSSSNDPGNGPGGPVSGESMGTIEGIAQDGPLNDATVTAYAWNGSKGAVLGSGRTDFQGRYSLSIQAATQPVLLEVMGGFYVEEASFKQVSLIPNQALLSLINYGSGQRQSAMVTYYTTLASGLAERLVRNGASPTAAVTAANQRISALLNLDITTVSPADTTRSDLGTFTPSVAYGFGTAAVSSFTDFVANSNPSGPRVTSIEFIQLAYEDIRSDGVLDGRGQSRDLFVGTMPLTADSYRHELALHVLRLGDNPTTNFSRINIADLVPVAKSLNDSTDGIFGSAPVVELASNAPNISAVSIDDQAVIFGKSSISVTVGSVSGVNRVDAQLVDANQQVVLGPVAAPDAKHPIIVIDTTAIPDGAYQLTLSVTDTAGAVSRKTIAVTVNNQPVIDNVSLPTDRPVRGVQTVRATINDPVGVAKVEYLVNGMLMQTFPNPSQESPNPLAPYILDTTRLNSGQNTLRITLTNQLGGMFTIPDDVTFLVDNRPPTLTAVTPAAGAFVKQVRGTSGEELFDEQNRRIGFMVGGTADDGNAIGNGIASVEVLVNDVSVGTRPTLPFPVPFQPDGVKNILLRVRDLAGNLTDDTRQITFDATPPTAMIESPLGPDVSGQIRVLGNANDSFGLSRLRLGLVEIARNVEIACLGGDLPDLNGRFAVNILTQSFTNTQYRLTLHARDQAGNESASQPVVLTFNNSSARTEPNQFNATPQCVLSQ